MGSKGLLLIYVKHYEHNKYTHNIFPHQIFPYKNTPG